MRHLSLAIVLAVCVIFLGFFFFSLHEPASPTQFQVDPFWPKPLPNDWLTGRVGGECVDSQDHVFMMSRTADPDNLTDDEKKVWRSAPPVIEFDEKGSVVNSWGDPKIVPAGLHDCYFDDEGNMWISGGHDGIAQKYNRNGKLLLQIGIKGKFDTTDGTAQGEPLNSSHTLLNKPSSFAVDPSNGDVYIADGYGNRRIVVFDRSGNYILQFGRQATQQESEANVGGVFASIVHSVVLSNDGLVYVADREGRRIQVFDKMGNFKSNIFLKRRKPDLPGHGWPWSIVLSRDNAQKYMYVADGIDAVVWTLDRQTGQTLSGFGQAGHMAGEFYLHTIAMNSKGDIFVGESGGQRIQKFSAVGNWAVRLRTSALDRISSARNFFHKDRFGEKQFAAAKDSSFSEKVPPTSDKFKVDPFWPKPLPNDWLIGKVGGTCVDSDDHVFAMSSAADVADVSDQQKQERAVALRNKGFTWVGVLDDSEKETRPPAPPVTEFNNEGQVINSWGDSRSLPAGLRDCYFDYEGNIWITGGQDGIAQKYSRDGKLLVQIGTRGKFDTTDGAAQSALLNSSHTLLNKPSSIAVDPSNGDVYIADGYGNRRIAVFDRSGKFLRQFGRQATQQEADSGVGGVFLQSISNVLLSRDGLLYVADREGRRIQVFDKMGEFKKNIFLKRRRPDLPGYGSPWSLAFSTDQSEKYLYVADGVDSVIWTLDRESGETLSGFGRAGHMAGEFYLHSIAMNSKGDIFIGESGGERIQRLRATGTVN